MFKSRVSRPLRHEMLETRRVLDGGALGAAGEPVPDFSLNDVNGTSPFAGQSVTRGSFSGTTAVYFIHST